MSRLSATIAMLEDIRDTAVAGINALIEGLETGGLPQGEYEGEKPPADTPDEPPAEDPPAEEGDPPADEPDEQNPDPAPPPAAPPSGAVVKTVSELTDALSSAKPGDVIPVGGVFPEFTLSDIRFNSRVTLKGINASYQRVTLKNCANIVFDGGLFMPQGTLPAPNSVRYLLTGDKSTSGILVTGADFHGGKDAANFAKWSATEWGQQKIGAAHFPGPDNQIENCCALAVNFGFSIGGINGFMKDLRVCGHTGDSYRANGSNFKARGLWATDGYRIDGNHPDSLQSFDLNDPISDHDIEDCIFMEYSTPTDQRGSIGAAMQILGYHDGPYHNLNFRRIVGSSSTWNALHAPNCDSLVGDRLMFWTVPGRGSGQTRIYPSGTVEHTTLTKAYADKARAVISHMVQKPDYTKLPNFFVPALRGSVRPDIDALIGW